MEKDEKSSGLKIEKRKLQGASHVTECQSLNLLLNQGLLCFYVCALIRTGIRLGHPSCV